MESNLWQIRYPYIGATDPLRKRVSAIGELNDKLGRKGAKTSHPIETAILLSPR